MDLINGWGVGVIAALQRMPFFVDSPYSSLWLFITKLGDPATIFILHVPLLFVFLNRTAVFVQFFLATCISEFLNGVFKWLLMADRPYWWVHTHGIANQSLAQLKQFPPTCETGPGSPSGHCMVTGAAWIVIAMSQLPGRNRYIAFSIYFLTLVLLALSRLYVATHFPHQVILGAIIGALIGLVCTRIKVSRVTLGFCIKLALGLAILAIKTYKALQLLGFDPDWSIKLAMRYCQNKEWIHLTTTPFASLFRDVGALLGLGIVAQWSKKSLTRGTKGPVVTNGLGTKILAFLLCLIFAQFITRLPIFEWLGGSMTWFYSIIAIENMILILFYTVLVPAFVGLQEGTEEPKKVV